MNRSKKSLGILSDDSWARMAPYIVGDGRGPGAAGRNNRMFVEAVLWKARTGSAWTDLPPGCGMWNSAFRRFRRWGQRGVWYNIFAAMADDPDFEFLIADDEIIYTGEHISGQKERSLVIRLGSKMGTADTASRRNHAQAASSRMMQA